MAAEVYEIFYFPFFSSSQAFRYKIFTWYSPACFVAFSRYKRSKNKVKQLLGLFISVIKDTFWIAFSATAFSFFSLIKFHYLKKKIYYTGKEKKKTPRQKIVTNNGENNDNFYVVFDYVISIWKIFIFFVFQLHCVSFSFQKNDNYLKWCCTIAKNIVWRQFWAFQDYTYKILLNSIFLLFLKKFYQEPKDMGF